jgi:hypothetical protein
LVEFIWVCEVVEVPQQILEVQPSFLDGGWATGQSVGDVDCELPQRHTLLHHHLFEVVAIFVDLVVPDQLHLA